MSDKALVSAPDTRALSPAQERTERIRGALATRLPDLLPKGTSVDRFVAMTMQAVAKDPKLSECEPASIIMAALEAAQVGLEPTGAIGGAHIVGFKTNVGTKQNPHYETRAQLIYDYRGLQHLIRQGGGGEVKAVLVYEGDHFKVVEGTAPRIEHEPAFATTNPSDIRFVYAWPVDHPEKFEVMTKDQIDGIRARSKGANSGPWVTDYGQQARKTVIKRLANYLDLKPATRQLIEQDAEREFGDGVVAETTAGSRTAAAKAAIAARLDAGKPVPVSEAPGAQEAGEVESDATPAESAAQQPQGAATADATMVCGSLSDPALGDIEECRLDEGHAGPHKSDGAVWPNKGGGR